MKRVLTAAVLIPLVLGLIFWAPHLYVRWALALVALLCLREFLGLAAHYGVEPMGLVAWLAGIWVVVAATSPGAPFFLLVTLLLLTLFLRAGGEPSGVLPAVAATLLGIVYTTVPFRLAADLHARAGPPWLFYVLLINWVGDTAAYYVGRLLGRHKLAPRLSPGKTWEGAAASLLISVPLATLYLTHHAPHPPNGTFVWGLSVAANIAAQIGDLAESALKRGAGVKDSGALLPGHGGLLDRLDGVLFSLPVVYLAAVVWH